MEKSKFFEREIQLIESEELRDFVRYYFEECVGDWFWTSKASASGKFHPDFTKSEGGLVKHTRAVAMFCYELLRLSTYSYMKDEYKDYAIIACLLHDTCKYGEGNEEDKSAYANHGAIAALRVQKIWFDFFGKEAPELLTMAIRSHMGQWVTDKEDRPFTTLDRLVHLADYIASRPFIDIPSISFEYSEDRGVDIEEWLPF